MQLPPAAAVRPASRHAACPSPAGTSLPCLQGERYYQKHLENDTRGVEAPPYYDATNRKNCNVTVTATYTCPPDDAACNADPGAAQAFCQVRPAAASGCCSDPLENTV